MVHAAPRRISRLCYLMVLRLHGGTKRVTVVHAAAALVGAAWPLVGRSNIVWGFTGVEHFPYVSGVASIVLSLALSPVLAAMVATLSMLGMRTVLLRQQNAAARTLWVRTLMRHTHGPCHEVCGCCGEVW